MFKRTGRPGLVVAVIVAGLAGPAAAASTEAVAAVRGSRPVSIGLSPGGPLADLRYPAIPLPALRLGVSLSPRLTVDLTGGMLKFHNVDLGLVDLGGFTAWADLGPVLVKGNKGTAVGAYASVGLGYRFGAGPKTRPTGPTDPTRTIDPGLDRPRVPDWSPGRAY